MALERLTNESSLEFCSLHVHLLASCSLSCSCCVVSVSMSPCSATLVNSPQPNTGMLRSLCC